MPVVHFKHFIGSRALSRAVIIGFIQVCPTILSAAEFEVVDKLRVDAYAVIQGSADVQGAGFSVGGSSFAVSYGKIGIGTAAPAALLHISSAAGAGGDLVLISTGSSDVIRMTGAGEIYAAKYYGNALQGLAAPATTDSAANKAYVDAVTDICAYGNAALSDIVSGKTADLNCDGALETGTLPIRTLDPASDTVAEGYYNATTLAAVDADLAAANIVNGVTIFGYAGTFPALPAPDIGGTWLLVPGDAALGTRDFWVQKYEAKNVGSVPTSQPSGTPWVSITQIESKLRCEALGPGYHLLAMEEAQTISRNIENNAWNWDGGSVGSGGLWRGHTDGSPDNSLEADVTGDPDDDPYVGTGNVTPSIERRGHQLSSGQYLWDWSGNVWEWVDMTCTAGAGAGYWYDSGAYIEWDDANLSDYEKVRAGPAGAYTSAQNAGRYIGCTSTGNAGLRGGCWNIAATAGVFAFALGNIPSASYTTVGFRCAR